MAITAFENGRYIDTLSQKGPFMLFEIIGVKFCTPVQWLYTTQLRFVISKCNLKLQPSKDFFIAVYN